MELLAWFFGCFAAQYLLVEFGQFSSINAQLLSNLFCVVFFSRTGTCFFLPKTSACNDDHIEALAVAARGMVGYQLFNTLMEVRHFRDHVNKRRIARPFAINLTHHLSAAAGAYYCLQSPETLLPFFAYYGCVSEWSTVFLIGIDFVRKNRYVLSGCAYYFYLVWLAAFALVFLNIRVLGWLLYTAKHAGELWRLGSGPAIACLGALTVLQLLWGKRVLGKVNRLARHGSSASV